MKLIATSQRVCFDKASGEFRDCLDKRWSEFLTKVGVICAPIPNNPRQCKMILHAIKPAGVLLTGGNTPVAYGGESAEKDATDILLIDYAIKHNVPLIGVCRGMQSIALYYGAALARVEGHSNTRHTVFFGGTEIEVNSYHDFGIFIDKTNLVPLAVSKDGVIKAIQDPLKLVFGIMWHPERERPFQGRDMELFRSWLL